MVERARFEPSSPQAGPSAGPAGRDEVAPMRVPVAGQLAAGGLIMQTLSDVLPTGSPVLVHEGEGGGIRDALQAEDLDQPVKQGQSVMGPHHGYDAPLGQALMETGEVAGLGGQAADLSEDS